MEQPCLVGGRHRPLTEQRKDKQSSRARCQTGASTQNVSAVFRISTLSEATLFLVSGLRGGPEDGVPIEKARNKPGNLLDMHLLRIPP